MSMCIFCMCKFWNKRQLFHWFLLCFVIQSVRQPWTMCAAAV